MHQLVVLIYTVLYIVFTRNYETSIR